MKLHKNTRYGAEDLYHIYELDFDTLSGITGYTSDYSSDSIETQYKFRKWHVYSSSIGEGISLSIPRSEDQSGNIIPYKTRYVNEVNNVWNIQQYILDTLEPVTVGERPLDWGTNPNYILKSTSAQYFNNAPQGGSGTVTFMTYQQQDIQSQFDPSLQYYHDKDRVFCRMFYTDTNHHFAVTKNCFYETPNSKWCARRYLVSGYNPNYNVSGTSTWESYRKYYFGTDNTVYGGGGVGTGNFLIANKYGVNISHASPDTDFNCWRYGYNTVMCFVHYVASGVDYYGIAEIGFNTDDPDTNEPIAIQVVAYDSAWWGTSIIGGGGEEGYGSWGSNNQHSGGEGTFSFSSNDRGDATGTSLNQEMTGRVQGFNNAVFGLYKIHEITATEMTDIMTALYYSGVSSEQGISDFFDRFKLSMYNPMSAVLAVNVMPYDLIPRKGDGDRSRLSIAGYDVSNAINHVTPPTYQECEQIGTKFIGSYNFDESHVFDAFPDFAPYTKIKLHLPYIGVIDIDTNAVMYGQIAVTYYSDIISGNITAFVWCEDKDGHCTYKYTATGNCAYSFPLFSMSQDGSAVGKLIGSGVNMIGGALSGNPMMIASGITGTAESLLSASLGKRETTQGGSYSGNASILGDATCYLEITRPVWVEPEHYQKLKGITAELSGTIADAGNGEPYAGYILIDSIDLDNVNATENEKNEIENLLKSGVYIRGSEIT